MIKQYKFAICDDDIQFCNKIKSYIIEYYGENKVDEYSTHSEPHRPALRATYSII